MKTLFHSSMAFRLGYALITAAMLICGYSSNASVPQPATNATCQVLVRLAPGTDPKAFALRQGLVYQRTLVSDPDLHVLAAESQAKAAALVNSVKTLSLSRGLVPADSSLRNAWINRLSLNKPMAFVPNDPYFPDDNPPGFPGQWHLVFTNHPEWDAAVQGAWNRDLTGTNVMIGICDNGVDHAHPDLSPGYSPADSYDFVDKDPDPSPVLPKDNHGTSVAGVAAARGGNGLGVTGSAPLASLAGLRVLNKASQTSDYVDATLFHSSGTNRNIRVKNHSYGVDEPFADNSAERDAFQISADAGTLHCLSAGNEREGPAEDSNKKSIQTSPWVINVAALSSSGIFASYSCFGANVFVTAPSSSFRDDEYSITTTDRLGTNGYNNFETPGNPYPDLDYTADFGGTSSASPLVAGIMALGLQANPSMTVRLAKHLLARSSDRVDPGDTTEASDGGWKTNAAGFVFNQNYGFGKINADRFTRLAERYCGVTPLIIHGHTQPVPVDLPLDAGKSARFSFSLSATNPLETVELGLVITNIVCRDLEVYLTAPTGTRSRMLMRGIHDTNDAVDNLEWVCASHAFWGENPNGNWTITVSNTGPVNGGPWMFCKLVANAGQPVPRPVILPGSLQWQPDGRMQFAFTGLAGTTNVVQASTNLLHWDDIMDVVLTNSTMTVEDPEAAPGRKFYRIKVP